MLLALSKEHPSTNNNHAAGFNINSQPNTEESDTIMNNAYDNQKNPENSNNCKHSSTDTTSTTVIIGSSIGTFSIDELSQLSYFEAIFSSRWSNNTSNNNKK